VKIVSIGQRHEFTVALAQNDEFALMQPKPHLFNVEPYFETNHFKKETVSPQFVTLGQAKTNNIRCIFQSAA